MFEPEAAARGAAASAVVSGATRPAPAFCERIAAPMLSFLVRRLVLALVTLVLLSVIVFALGQLLPGNVGRNVLGGFASQESVDAFNKEHGLDKPACQQYLDWASHAVRGDFGTSYTSGESVNSILARALPEVGRARGSSRS